LDITIDRTSATPIYRQIVQRIRDMVTGGALPEGFRLPPERRLAAALGVNRTTVLNAYRELKAAGLVGAHVGRGTTVLRPPSPPAVSGRPALPWRQLFRAGPEGRPDPLIRDLLELTERHDVVSLSIGLPAPELVPVDTLRRIILELTDEVGPALFLHCPSEGHTPLRETLSRWLATRGLRSSPSEAVVLSGSQQGLDLTARVLLEPGDTVVVEEPTYIGALQAFRAARVRLVGVPTDADGMRTELLEAVLARHRPRLVYTLPTFQNPSGAVLSLERRVHLLELAYRYQVPVLEDDPYSELRYEGEPLPSLKALDRHDHVIYLSTFSKMLFPGMRLGFAVAPREVARQLVLARQSVDLHANTFAQWVLDRFIGDGHLEPHLRTLRRAYAARRDAMDAALSSSGASSLSWRRPQGGFYIWCRLAENVDQARLLASAADKGVAFLPGWSCFADDAPADFVRLNFSVLAAGADP